MIWYSHLYEDLPHFVIHIVEGFNVVTEAEVELSTMTCPSWVTLHGIAQSFIELHEPLHHDKAVIQEGPATSIRGQI